VNGEFVNSGDRSAVLRMLVRLHRAHAATPRADELVVPHLDALRSMLSDPRGTWRGGPYAQRGREPLDAHAPDLEVLLKAYRYLARRVASRENRFVITHGEPHAANVITAPGGLVLVDWDTVLLAPPERGLWDMADHDESVLDTTPVLRAWKSITKHCRCIGCGATSPKSAATSGCSADPIARRRTPLNHGATSSSFCVLRSDGRAMEPRPNHHVADSQITDDRRHYREDNDH